ncbi:MAG: LCP family protein, partial [Lachnospiraceae bacterium]
MATNERNVNQKRSTPQKKNTAKKKKRNKNKKILLFIIEIIVLIVLVAVLYLVLKTEKVERVIINEEDIVVNQAVSENETLLGYRNIALFGVDSRDKSLGKGNRTDTIMIASINLDTGDIKLVSVFRDTYLNLGNDSYNKANAAYAQGGPEQAINMLNMNLDLNIKDYITIGFTGLIDTIDALGGIQVNVLESEIKHLNNYQISMVGTSSDGITFVATDGKDYTSVKNAGLQTLNGLQATAYCRIRYVGDDFQRTQRQRDVIAAMIAKAKTLNVTDLNKVVDAALSNVSTSLGVSEFTDVLASISKYNIVDNDGFPFEGSRTTGKVGAKGSCVIPVDLQTNVVKLHQFLFEQ